MPELLIELFSEEIPARMQVQAMEDFRALVLKGLKDSGVEHTAAHAHATPRRIVLVIEGLPDTRPDTQEERRGPKLGAPDAALTGFLKSCGLGSAEQCTQRDGYYYAILEKKGGKTADTLPKIIETAIQSLVWPKSMRWGEGSMRWVRPLHTILAIFGGEPLTGRIEIGDGRMISYGSQTRGHRFLAPTPFPVKAFSDYKAGLKDRFVLLDREERKKIILDGAKALAESHGLVLRDDPALLEEVCGLVENPVMLCGAFDPAFLDVPQEVLIATMRANQKYFPLFDSSGRLANRFIITANMPDTHGNIVRGNERVLRARLSDARFFWDEDRKIRLDARIDRLDAITFHEKLGTVRQKVSRLERLARYIARETGTDETKAARAAHLCKADLVTGMVGEFPEVQGIMGRYYALEQKEPPEVAEAIAEHYRPAGPNDSCPAAPVSVALALTDKVDSLVGFFAVGLKPTGSKDPFALRRAALGIIRIITENNLRIVLEDMFSHAMLGYVDQKCPAVLARLQEVTKTHPTHATLDDAKAHYHVFCGVDLADFIDDRMKVSLRDRGYRHDLVEAIMATRGSDDIVGKISRLKAVDSFLKTTEGGSLMTACRRAVNILRAEEKKDNKTYDPSIEEATSSAGSLAEEKTLATALDSTKKAVETALASEDYAAAMRAMATLRAPLDAFFEKVTVNDKDPALRDSRLRLLSFVRNILERVADFSRLEG